MISLNDDHVSGEPAHRFKSCFLKPKIFQRTLLRSKVGSLYLSTYNPDLDVETRFSSRLDIILGVGMGELISMLAVGDRQRVTTALDYSEHGPGIAWPFNDHLISRGGKTGRACS